MPAETPMPDRPAEIPTRGPGGPQMPQPVALAARGVP
jgi:hypothetical protein